MTAPARKSFFPALDITPRNQKLNPTRSLPSPVTFHPLLPTLAICLVAACSPGPGSAIPENRAERQMLGFIAKFDRWDDNGDGELSYREINAGIATLKGGSKAVTYTAADVVKYYDRNGDKTVSMSEAQAGYKRTTEDNATALRAPAVAP